MQAVPPLIVAADRVHLSARPTGVGAALVAIVVVAALQIGSAAAQRHSQSDPAAFIATLRTDILAASAPGQPSDEARATLDRLVTEAFDLAAIAAAALRPAGDAATPQQRERLSRVLGRRMTEELVRRRGAREVEFSIGDVRAIAPAEWLVATQVSPAGEPTVIVGWRVRNVAGGLRIVDVVRNGVSIVITQRQEIASALRAQRPLDSIIDDIERHAAAATERP